jgi:hypothetical protein
MSLGPQGNGFTAKVNAFVYIINVAVLCEA